MYYFYEYRILNKLQIIILEILFILNFDIIIYQLHKLIYNRLGDYISIYSGLPITYNFIILALLLELYICFKIKKILEK